MCEVLLVFVLVCIFYFFVTNKKNNETYNPYENFHPATHEVQDISIYKPTVENPEGYIEMMNNLGDSIQINKLTDNITSDKISVINSESTVEQLCRSMWDANNDGPQMEGMTAPIDEFEKVAMTLQNSKANDLYVDYKSQSADQLAEANI